MYRDLCVDPSNRFHDCASPVSNESSGPFLFIDGLPVDCPQPLLYPRVAANEIQQVVIGLGQESAAWLCRPGKPAQALPIYVGPPGIEWRDGVFHLWIQVAPTRLQHWRLDPSGELLGEPADVGIGLTSQGIADVVGGLPIQADDTFIGPVLAGYSTWRPIRRGPWIVAQSDPAPIVAWDGETLSLVWNGQTPIPPRAAWNGTELRVAISSVPDVPILRQDALRPYWPHLVPFARPMLLGPFFATSNTYGSGEYAGNCEVLVADGNPPQGVDASLQRIVRPVICDAYSHPLTPADRRLALWAAEGRGQTLAQAITSLGALAAPDRLPLAIYTDARVYDSAVLPTWVRGDLALLQAYRDRDESVADFERSVQTQIRTLGEWQVPVVLVLGFDDRGWFTDADLLATMPAYDRLLRERGVVGGLAFSARRPRGMITHPVLVPWWDSFCAAALPQGRLPLEPVVRVAALRPPRPPAPESPPPPVDEGPIFATAASR